MGSGDPSLCDAVLGTEADAIVASDSEGIIRFWNAGAERIFGYSTSEALGQSLDIIIPERLRHRHWAGYRQVMASGTSRYGRGDVLAVPGHPSYPGAAGTNALLRDGAVLVRGAADVTEALGMPDPVTEKGAEDGDRVLRALGRDAPASFEELLGRIGGSASDLLARLAELEIESKVRRLPGSLFVRY